MMLTLAPLVDAICHAAFLAGGHLPLHETGL